MRWLLFAFGLMACEPSTIRGARALDAGSTPDASREVPDFGTDAAPETLDAAPLGPLDASPPLDASIPRDSGVGRDAGRPDVQNGVGDASAPDAEIRCGDSVCNDSEDCNTCPDDCGACGWPEAWARAEETVLSRVNAQRAKGATCGLRTMPPVPPLRMDPALREAARLHSKDMAEQNYFSHASLDGRDFAQRILAAGYSGQPAAENIAAGNPDPDGTFEQWMGSSGHCSNMLSGSFTEIGIGYAFGANAQFGHYWTQTFGVR